MERIAIFPGSFDPFTIGHDSVVRRALPLFDKIIIGIGVNADKKPLFPVEKRVEAIQALYKNDSRIEVMAYDTLTITFAKKVNANFILRGLRSVRDFEYERDIADLNKQSTGIETILLFTENKYGCISSSAIRELISYGEDVTEYLPKPSEK
ncbi:MAG: pantetheine-phosphate adenylyltransferase [Alistipes sp.]|nr:pantetheine-phosphate adenylyltransferase [Candidatus Alistipes equi]